MKDPLCPPHLFRARTSRTNKGETRPSSSRLETSASHLLGRLLTTVACSRNLVATSSHLRVQLHEELAEVLKRGVELRS